MWVAGWACHYIGPHILADLTSQLVLSMSSARKGEVGHWKVLQSVVRSKVWKYLPLPVEAAVGREAFFSPLLLASWNFTAFHKSPKG